MKEKNKKVCRVKRIQQLEIKFRSNEQTEALNKVRTVCTSFTKFIAINYSGACSLESKTAVFIML
jgi:predicted transcriptional regulator